MEIWYHGTTKENAESILKDGFKDRSFFTEHLSSAISFGGDWVFHVLFSERPVDYWEYTSPNSISKDKILYLVQYNLNLIYWNHKADLKRQHLLHLETYDEKTKLCDSCNGRGELPSPKGKGFLFQ